MVARRDHRAGPRGGEAKRHSKPQLTRNGDEPYRRLLAGAGQAEGVEVADLVAAVTRASGLEGEAVRDVRVLQRFSLLSVPASEVDRVLAEVDGTEVRGLPLRIELARA